MTRVLKHLESLDDTGGGALMYRSDDKLKRDPSKVITKVNVISSYIEKRVFCHFEAHIKLNFSFLRVVWTHFYVRSKGFS